MSEPTAHIGILSLELYLPSSGSLKSKRRVLKSLKDRVRSQFNVSIAEIGELDKWQKAVIGICVIGNDKSHLDRSLQNILSFADGIREFEVVDYKIEFN